MGHTIIIITIIAIVVIIANEIKSNATRNMR
jgi:hypothetical protein